MPEITLNADGSIDLRDVRNYSITDITEIESYAINRTPEEVSHEIKFIGGGNVKFRYSATDGEILEFVVTDMSFTKTTENDVFFNGTKGRQ